MTARSSPDTSQTLLDLAERCEKATGPDRELDALIARSLGWVSRPHMDKDWYPNVWIEPNNGWQSELPFYTASIDAAMTLVPEGLHWVLKSSDPKAIARIGGWKTGDYRIIGGEATTPALALCAAALRARSPDVQGK